MEYFGVLFVHHLSRFADCPRNDSLILPHSRVEFLPGRAGGTANSISRAKGRRSRRNGDLARVQSSESRGRIEGERLARVKVGCKRIRVNCASNRVSSLIIFESLRFNEHIQEWTITRETQSTLSNQPTRLLLHWGRNILYTVVSSPQYTETKHRQ